MTGGVAQDTNNGSTDSDVHRHGPTTKHSMASSLLSLSGAISTTRGSTSDDANTEIASAMGLLGGDSHFILDDVGRHILDSEGSPAKTRKWLPTNAYQRERYT